MEYIEEGVEEYLNGGERFSDAAKWMWQALKDFHMLEYVHTDLSPKRFRIRANQEIVLCGLRKSRKTDASISHSQAADPIFISLDRHDHLPRQRDDLESLVYTLLHLLHALPWSHLTHQGHLKQAKLAFLNSDGLHPTNSNQQAKRLHTMLVKLRGSSEDSSGQWCQDEALMQSWIDALEIP